MKHSMKVDIIADSITESGHRLITLHARYPRIIHSEIMTHRVFSRNARSSRAVPIETMLREIKSDPFIPWHWGKNQKGMQASTECDELLNLYETSPLFPEKVSREQGWIHARDEALRVAQEYSNAGYHKQVANRLLEPFMYIDTLISSTSWANFFHLRKHKDAEPHFQDLANMIYDAFEASTPTLKRFGEWHLPYILDEESHLELEIQQKLSVARCARISYKPFDGDSSIEKELERYNLLVGSSPLHASPAEHQGMADAHDLNQVMPRWKHEEYHGNFNGWAQYRKFLNDEYIAD